MDLTDREKKSRAVLGLVRELVRGEEGVSDDDAQGQQQFDGLELAPEQDAAVKGIVPRIAARVPLTALAGYAGTGKTLTAGVIALELEKLGLRVAYCAPTGKAAGIFRRSLAAQGIKPRFCGTIHRLIYRPVVDAQGNIKKFDKVDDLPYDVVVIEEASMVTSKILDDLKGYNKPLLAIGDHGQLPPVGEDVGLMANPDFRLETVRRQALENPVIALSMLMRRGADWRSFVEECQRKRLAEIRRLPAWDYMRVLAEAFQGFTSRPMADDPLVIVRSNEDRVRMNAAIRTLCLGEASRDPVVKGERVIVVKNAYLEGALVANGFRGRVQSLGWARNANHLCLNVVFPDEGMGLDQGRFSKHQFGRSATFKTLDDVPGAPNDWEQVGLLADYGYALTCHKSQGSQAQHAIVRLQRGGMPEDEWRRWTYTAVTRTTQQLTLIY